MKYIILFLLSLIAFSNVLAYSYPVHKPEFFNTKVTDNTTCIACVYIVSMAEDWLTSNTTVTEIIEFLDDICSADLPSFGPICDSIANMGFAQFISYVENYETPEILCVQLGICSPSSLYCPFINHHINDPLRK
jgi:hypothetical protein